MNRLEDSTSPHLRQHAADPVHWQPWDAEALALARREGKPILLSIGSSSSHLCHVMARESFNSRQTAALMNDNYVNIKVDREERPDLDRIYQAAHQLLNRKPGGWPLTVFLDPEDQLPLFSGTYFPPQANRDAPGFRDVLKGMAKSLANNNDKMAEFKTKLREALAHAPGNGGPGPLDSNLIERACGQIDASFDGERGGFSGAPKYPHPTGLSLMLDAAACESAPEKSARLLSMLDFTLAAMTRGGLHDHIGGGFFRYCVDAYWDIPGFEKMLYDNSMLLSVIARRAAQTDSAWLRSVAERTAGWLVRDLALANGAMGASLDADVDATEGAGYTWNIDELGSALSEDYDTFADAFGLNQKANFKGNWHLRMSPPDKAATVDDAALETTLAAARERLLETRTTRSQPPRDEQVLASWNALAIRGLVDAGTLLGHEDYFDTAIAVADFIETTHWHDGKLYASSYDGIRRQPGCLDDYAFLLDAQLALLTARWSDDRLRFAIELADAMLEQFEDQVTGGFYFTAHDHEKLIQRIKPYADDALPAGNGRAVSALLELAFLVNEPRFANAAERALTCGMTDAGNWPSAHATLMSALLDFTQPPVRVIVRSAANADTTAWRKSCPRDGRLRIYAVPATAQPVAGLLSNRPCPPDTALAAYVYRGDDVAQVTDPQALAGMLSTT